MKKHNLVIVLFLIGCLTIVATLGGCSTKLLDNSEFGNLLPELQEPQPPVTHETLKDKDGWISDTLDNGLIHYQFAKYIQTQTANQFVNVMELDLTNPDYELEFVSLGDRDT